jgi:hypothetical protein
MAEIEDDEKVRVLRPECLVSWGAAAVILGRSRKTLTNWADEINVPTVRTPGGHLSTYRSWLDAVLASARPGLAGDIAAVTDNWWAVHFPQLREEAA